MASSVRRRFTIVGIAALVALVFTSGGATAHQKPRASDTPDTTASPAERASRQSATDWSDATMTYHQGRGGPESLVICHNWDVDVCLGPTGVLRDGENSQTKYGWTDVDGYFQPSGYRSKPCVGSFIQLCYMFSGRGWIKTRGLYGGEWSVTVEGIQPR